MTHLLTDNLKARDTSASKNNIKQQLCSDDGPRESETLTKLKYIIAGISSPLKTLALAGKVASGGLEA